MDPNVVVSDYECPQLGAQSLAELLYKSLKESANKTVFIDTVSGRQWTRGQVLEAALNFAAYLTDECHVSEGDIVFFVCENCDIHAIAMIGVLFAGCVYGSIPDHSAQREIRELVYLINPKVLVGFGKNHSFIEEIGEEASIHTLELQKSLDDLTVEDILDLSITMEDKRFPIFTKEDSPATLMLSSGSSGRPKAIIKNNRNHLATIACLSHPEMMPFNDSDIFLSSGFCHICGQRNLFASIALGAQLAIIRSDESHKSVIDAINNYSITSGVLMPTTLQYLIKNGYTRESLSTFRDVMTGAAHMSAALHSAIRKTFEFEKFRNSYGMSEVGFVLMVPLSRAQSMDADETVGKVTPGYRVKVVDANGQALGPNRVGEICIAGDGVTPGYLNMKKQNSQLFTPDGFLKSQDLGYYDENNYFYICGRMKDIIKVDGVTVALREIEQVLITHKDVADVAVIGVKDIEKGEVPMAFVTLVDGSDLSDEDLISHFNARVNDHKKLEPNLVRVMDKLPRTHSGKVRKSELYEIAMHIF